MFVQFNNEPNMSITAQLSGGTGCAGSLLDSDVLSLPNVLPTNSPLFFDFTGNTLTSGVRGLHGKGSGREQAPSPKTTQCPAPKTA